MSNEFCYIEVCFLLLLLFTFLSVKIILSSSNLWVYLVSCFSVIQCPQRCDCTSLGQQMRFDCVCVHMCVCKFCDQFKCSHNCMYINYTCIYYIGRDWCEVSLVDPRSGPTLYFYSNSLMYSCLCLQWYQHTALSCTFFCILLSVTILQNIPQKFSLKNQKVFCNGKWSLIRFNGKRWTSQPLWELVISFANLLFVNKGKVFAISRGGSAHTELQQSMVKLGQITRDVFRSIHL